MNRKKELKKTKSFSGQLKKAFISIILVPVLCLGGFVFYSSFHFIRQQKKVEISNIIEQNQIDLKNRLGQGENSILYGVSNQTLQDFLQIKETNYLELNEKSKSIGPLLYNIVLSNQYYKKLSVYTVRDFNVLNDLVFNQQDVEGEDWYQQTLLEEGTCWWYEDGRLFISRKISTAYPVKNVGVMRVELKPDIFESSFNIFEDVPVQIKLKNPKGTTTVFANTNAENLKLIESAELGNTGWFMQYRITPGYYNQHIVTGILVPMLVICIVLILVWIVMRILSKSLVADLFVLVDEVNEVQSGNFDVVIQQAEMTEIDILAKSIESMLHKIKQLIRQVYVKEIERQDLELNLLQAKISPHFLYNNLSAINWLALDCGQDKIYEITTEMATFYRTALNKGKNIDKLSIEISNIKAYINLQLISHEESFDVEYEVPSELLSYDAPIFILQPLVENAIEHGIDQLREGRGYLRISAWKEEKDLYLTVYDNGNALYEQIGAAHLEKDKYGYGTSNVDKRIQLLYGSEYGLDIYADVKGTTSLVHLRTDYWKKS